MNKNGQFQQILTENKDKIYRICCAYEKDKDERDDLFQEILLNIWKSLDKFEGRSAVSTWIYRIAVNTSLVHIRKSISRKENRAAYYDEIILNTNSDEQREEKLKTYEQTEKLYGCINSLVEFDRLIISMVLEDLSYKEISEVTGITVNNVGVKINRIKKELAKLMGA